MLCLDATVLVESGCTLYTTGPQTTADLLRCRNESRSVLTSRETTHIMTCLDHYIDNLLGLLSIVLDKYINKSLSTMFLQ